MLFPAELSAAHAAREWAAGSTLDHGGSDAARRLVSLLVSELVTNAVKYGPPGGVIDVDIRFAGSAARILVTDASPEHPRVLDPEPSASGGRGMRLVEALSTAWGVHPGSGPGKTVWLDVDLTITW